MMMPGTAGLVVQRGRGPPTGARNPTLNYRVLASNVAGIDNVR